MITFHNSTGGYLHGTRVLDSTVPLGAQILLIVSIRNPAVDGVPIALSASPPIPSLPPSVLIPGGQDYFVVRSLATPPSGTYTINASGGAVTLMAVLTVVR